MFFSTKFVSATIEKSTIEKSVPAPLMRRDFFVKSTLKHCEITVCALGFYEIFINGEHITRGRLSPYIVNPEHVLPYDNYDVTSLLKKGKNTVSFILGNGMQNRFDGYEWDFQLASFNSSPKIAFAIELDYENESTVIEADPDVLCHPSPILCDGYMMGERYDARLEIPNWNSIDFDTLDWTAAIPVKCDGGVPTLSVNRPILEMYEVKPVSITKLDDGYLYDFGLNLVGVTRISVTGEDGQKIVIDHGELLENGRLTQENLLFNNEVSKGKPRYTQRTEYICRVGLQTHTPTFTYYGFRYAFVKGITDTQATPELLTTVVMNTDLGDRGNFKCSDDILNTIQEMTRRSTLGNFQHFPNDCPHREKNGWTADAALSAEQTLMNFEPEDNYLMWEKCIIGAMDERGALPGIVPTGGWGFHWGNGPAWDCVLVYLPYFTAVLRDDLRMAKEASVAILRYFKYLNTRKDENGLLEIGLGDWCPTYQDYETPLIFTDSTISYDLAKKAEYLYNRLEMNKEAEFCRNFANDMRKAIREHLLEDKKAMRFISGKQSVQAMAIFYGLCDSPDEERAALSILIDEIHKKDDHLATGVLGGRVIFRVLCDFGYCDLALKMIKNPTAPSYRALIDDGLTTLPENLSEPYGSLNHHFWGDISALMIEHFGGIRINPNFSGADTVEIRPVFPNDLTYVEAYHKSVKGMIKTHWQKNDGKIELSLEIPSEITGKIVSPTGYLLDGKNSVEAKTGKYIFEKTSG